jgi:hypothetical protein
MCLAQSAPRRIQKGATVTLRLCLIVACCLLPDLARADGTGLFAPRQPLFAAPDAASRPLSPASLFVAPEAGGMLAPFAPRTKAPGGANRDPVAARIKDLIARAEAGPAGYDAVQHGARITPPKPPTQLTIAEIYRWIEETPGQPHAIGRYQFIPKTLRWLAARADLQPDTRFTPRVQDRLANLLLADAGYAAARAGSLPLPRFMDNLARIWAGLPTASGRSFYHGYAGNKATMSRAAFARDMRAILDARG